MSAREVIRNVLLAHYAGNSNPTQIADILMANARGEVLAEAAAFVGNDDDCDCGGCATCVPRKLAEGLLALASQQGSPAKADATPDVQGVVHAALSTVQGTAHHLGLVTLQLLTERVTEAVTPLVPYREVWDASLPPGGRVCSICGQPVESEPCPDHAPGFFRPGRTYLSPYSRFQCIEVTRDPGTRQRRVVGWYAPRDGGQWEIHDLDPDDHTFGGWTDVTEAGGR